MTYDEFDIKLKKMKLSKKDFSQKVGMSYSSVTNWKQTGSIPEWVESWIQNYKSSKKFETIKKALKDSGICSE